MKHLMTVVLLVAMTVSTYADFPDGARENTMGLFFSDSEFTNASTNFDPTPGVPFPMYLAFFQPTMSSVGGYEVQIHPSVVNGALPVNVTGDNGWGNFGTAFNQLVGFQVPPPASYGGMVLCTFSLITIVPDAMTLRLGPSNPSSVGGAGPAVADGTVPEDLYVCNYSTYYPDDPDLEGIVATLGGDGVMLYSGVVATESVSWSNVKGLFE